MQRSNDNLVPWKEAYLAAYARDVNRQRAGATDKLFSQAANLVMLPAAHDVIDAFAGLLDNLTLAPTTNRTTIQQLTCQQISHSQHWLQL
jgi:hypothetical protein